MVEGLESVVAAETVLSHVDGEAGRLVIRGHAVKDLAAHASFEDVAALLWSGFFPDVVDATTIASALCQARGEIFASVAPHAPALSHLAPLEALRALMARLPDGDDLATALRLAAATAVLLPAIIRARAGEPALAPQPDLGHAADMLAMLGSDASAARIRALDAYLVTVCDHGLNASTFAARVVASTRAGLTSAVTAGISALKGPLHGGAPGPVLDMLDTIGSPERAERWLEAALDHGDRLMGFGHRIYRVRDPRADALKQVVLGLGQDSSAGRVVFAEAVEAAALSVLHRRKPDRSLDTNVEFYTALLLEALGFPRDTFTAVFAAGRVLGWIAHAREQVATGRLVRPQSRYIGPWIAEAA